MPLVQDILRRFQVLLIIDNFETISDLALTRFALEGVPAPSKVVITTRDYHPTIWPGTWPIHLKGLEDTSALELVREWAHEHELQIVMKANEPDLMPLLRATEGNPYALLTALGLIANQKQPLQTVLRDLWEGRGCIFEYIFAQAWELLEESERRLLMIMPFFTDSATRKAIGATAGIEGYSLSKGIGRLAELSLIIPDDDMEETLRRYSVHPLTGAFAGDKLREHAKFEEEARVRWCEYYLQFAELCLKRDLPKERYWTSLAAVRSLTLLDPEWQNLLNVLAWADQHGEDRILIVLMTWLVHYMDRRILYAARLYYARRAAEAAYRLAQKVDEALLRIDGLGWTLIEEAHFAKAEKEIMAGLRIVEDLYIESPADANDLTALAYTFLARAYLERGGLDEQVLIAIEKAMRISCRPFIQSRVSMIAGDVARYSGRPEEAIKSYKQALEVSRQYDEGLGTEFHYRLGFAYLDIGEIDLAEGEFNYALKQRVITIEDVRSKYGQAHVAKKRNDIDGAYHWAQEARVELSRQHPALPLLNEIDSFLEGLEMSKSQGQVE
jgi:LuxR family glucitol operon transcriptional activator